MKRIEDMNMEELRKFTGDLGRAIEMMLPAGESKRGKCLFVLIFTPTCNPGEGQYVANVDRESGINLLRELADRLEHKEDEPR